MYMVYTGPKMDFIYSLCSSIKIGFLTCLTTIISIVQSHKLALKFETCKSLMMYSQLHVRSDKLFIEKKIDTCIALLGILV